MPFREYGYRACSICSWGNTQQCHRGQSYAIQGINWCAVATELEAWSCQDVRIMIRSLWVERASNIEMQRQLTYRNESTACKKW